MLISSISDLSIKTTYLNYKNEKTNFEQFNIVYNLLG